MLACKIMRLQLTWRKVKGASNFPTPDLNAATSRGLKKSLVGDRMDGRQAYCLCPKGSNLPAHCSLIQGHAVLRMMAKLISIELEIADN